MIQIGVRAHDCASAPFEQRMAGINKQGFACTQLALRKIIEEFAVDRGAMTPGMALYMKRILWDNKVDAAVLGCYFNLANPNKEALAETQEVYKAHIRFASLLGCGVVATETGAVNETYTFEPANHSEEALNIFIENLRPVVEYAEKMGVIFAIEPVYVHIVSDVQRTKKVLDAINSPNLQVLLDPVNLLSIDNYQNQDKIIEEAFELFGDDIIVIHAKDYIIENNNIKSVPAGKGQFDYGVLMKLLKAKKPFIQVLLEDTNPDNALECKAYVEEQYQKA